MFFFHQRKQRSSVTDANVYVMVFVVDGNRTILPSSRSFQIDIQHNSIARGPSTGCVIHFERHICVFHLFASFSI